MEAIDLLELSFVIAAVKDEKGVERCLQSDCPVVFVLCGNICTIGEIIRRLKEKKKYVIAHADLINGLGGREIVADFLKKNTLTDGIISTKPLVVKRAMELGLIGILRTFTVDSIALDTVKKQIDQIHPSVVEILPGVASKAIRAIREYTEIPIIAGGLISSRKEVMDAISAGADAISTTREELWDFCQE